MTKEEIWKDIPDYEGLYQVSNLGDIRSLKRKKAINLLPSIGTDGYYRLNLHKNGGKTSSIHRIVAQAFIPNPDNKPQVNHKDGNKLNNHFDNLEWCTPKENTNHAHLTGLANNSGINNYQSRLSVNDIIEIRRSNLSQRDLAKKYQVFQNTIHLIKSNKTYKNI
jgi:hypothetical protein